MKDTKAIVEAAQEAFWAKVVELVPDARTGDFDPLVGLHFDEACEGAVKHWVDRNVPRRPPTFAEFAQSGRRLTLQEYAGLGYGYATCDEAQAVLVYADGYVIEDRGPRYFVALEGADASSDSLVELELKLYDHALFSGGLVP